jgi:hypothetical protein
MSLRELRDYEAIKAFRRDVQERIRDSERITSHDSDYPKILNAQGWVQALEWVLEKLDEDEPNEEEPDYPGR